MSRIFARLRSYGAQKTCPRVTDFLKFCYLSKSVRTRFFESSMQALIFHANFPIKISGHFTISNWFEQKWFFELFWKKKPACHWLWFSEKDQNQSKFLTVFSMDFEQFVQTDQKLAKRSPRSRIISTRTSNCSLSQYDDNIGSLRDHIAVACVR